MISPSELPPEIQKILDPREDLEWSRAKGLYSQWTQPFLIENDASRAFQWSLLDQEKLERSVIREFVERELVKLPSGPARFWVAEFEFMGKLMSANQLTYFAPLFIRLTKIMPKELIQLRKTVVRKFLATCSLEKTEFSMRQQRKFVRSSVLLYASKLLITASNRFANILRNSIDQSASSNRRRVIMSVRALEVMSSKEICDRFLVEDSYSRELQFLETQCRFFQIKTSEVYLISGIKLREYWKI
ncbi:MAG: hypothetical protein JKY12_03905 [Sneathiella sp.]|nr:hypothetical protein [Sneathiella sp.]